MEANKADTLWLGALVGFLIAAIVAFAALAVLVFGTPLLAMAARLFDSLFGLSSVQAMWYVTRAAGLTAYLLLWLSTVWGLAVSSKIFDPVLNRFFTYDMHQFLSLLAIAFVILHVVVLLADRYLPFSLAQVVLPFGAPYRPVWVGVGVIALYLTLLVSLTFYVRRWIGQRTFRAIHYLSFLAFVGAAAHGLLAGTDSALWTTQLMYAGTALVVVFLTVYRITITMLRPSAVRAT